MEIYSLKSKFD